MRPLLTVIVLASLVAAPVRQARAQQEISEQNRAEAKQAYEVAQKLYAEGQYSAAVVELRKAYELAPLTPILFNLGMTYAKAGNRPAAKAALTEYLAKMPDAPNRAEAEQVLASLEEPSGDDTENPLTAAPRPRVVTPPPPPRKPKHEEDEEPDGPRFRTLKWAAAGVAVVTAVTGAVLLTRASDQADVLRSTSSPDGQVPMMRYSSNLRAIEDGYATNRTWGLLSLVGCGLASATSITMFVLDDRDAPDTRRARVAPVVGAGFAGLTAIGSF
jgi:tetratricopeptide (TPR) repeat protein